MWSSTRQEPNENGLKEAFCSIPITARDYAPLLAAVCLWNDVPKLKWKLVKTDLGQRLQEDFEIVGLEQSVAALPAMPIV